MSEHKQKVPKLRFPGFSGEWEQRELGELAEFSKGSGYTKNDLSESGSPIVLYGRLYTKYETVINDVDTFVEMKDKSVISEGNEIVVPASGESAEDISRASVIGKSGIILGGDLNIIKPNQEIDSTFLALTISNGKQQKEMSKRAQGKSVVHLQNSDLKQVNLIYPELEEQKEISLFFKKLDDLICIYKSKLGNVENLKAGLLQKMFPKNGEEVPEIRFSEFTDGWEQLRLEEIAEFNPKAKLPNEFKYVDLESVVGTNLVAFRTESKETAPSRAQRLAQRGDVFYQTVRPYQKNNYLYNLPDDNYVFSSGYAQMRPNINSYLLLSCLQQEQFVKTVLDKCTGTSYPAINSKDLAEIEVMVPIDTDEQLKIGVLFRDIDNLISLHQRKLEHLQQQKKALLQQMFV